METTTTKDDIAIENKEKEDKSPKGTVYLTEERCKGCSFCVLFCPTEALAMGTRLNRKGYRLPELAHPDKCNGCDMCGMVCPDFAIFGVNFKKQAKKSKESKSS